MEAINPAYCLTYLRGEYVLLKNGKPVAELPPVSPVRQTTTFSFEPNTLSIHSTYTTVDNDGVETVHQVIQEQGAQCV